MSGGHALLLREVGDRPRLAALDLSVPAVRADESFDDGLVSGWPPWSRRRPVRRHDQLPAGRDVRAARPRAAKPADAMKILVLGGYGVFGGRLVQLLLRDGHNVWAAGRNLQKAQRFTERHRGLPLQIGSAPRSVSDPEREHRRRRRCLRPFSSLRWCASGPGILPRKRTELSRLMTPASRRESASSTPVPAVSPYRVRRVYQRFRLPSRERCRQTSRPFT